MAKVRNLCPSGQNLPKRFFGAAALLFSLEIRKYLLGVCVGLCLDGVDLERELFRGQRFQGIFDHDYTSLNSSFPLFYHAESGLSPPFSRRVGSVMKLMKKSVLFFVKTLAFSGEKHIIQARINPVGALCAKGASWTKQKA